MKPQQQTKFYLTTRKAIRKSMKQLYHILKGKGGYDAVGTVWGVSGGMAWKMIKDRNYFPKDPAILYQLEIRARVLGFKFPVRREKDLFALPVPELRRRIEQREGVYK